MKKPTTLKEVLKKKLTKKQLLLLPRAYDVVGSIAIFSDLPKELSRKEKIIGGALISMHKNITTVCKKTTQYSGRFRTPKLKIIAGRRTKETIHSENGVRIKLNVEKVYFSVRLSTERRRIMEQVKKGESVLVMFSGCAPYPIVLAKNTQAKEIFGVEINPTAHDYALENIKLNKINNVKVYCGDVKTVVPKLKKKFDRILMPLPKSAEDFLLTAFKAAKKNTIIHFYDFADKSDIPKSSIAKIESACKKEKKKFKIKKAVKCGQYSPGSYRVCVDFVIL